MQPDQLIEQSCREINTDPEAGPDHPAAPAKADHEISQQSDGPRGRPDRHRGGPGRRPSAHAAPTRTGTSAAKTAGTPGPETLGDSVYPALGNDGYRVFAYHLDFSYDATTRLVDATATLKIRPTQALSRFSLDSLGLDIRSVRVGGRTAAFEQVAEKLRITPARTLPNKSWVTVCVEYSADPRRFPQPNTGWVDTLDGFAVCCQPNWAHTVFPCNDHPPTRPTSRSA